MWALVDGCEWWQPWAVVLSQGRSSLGLVVVEVGKVVVARQKTMLWQQSQHCLVIFRNMPGGMVYEV